MRVRLLYLLLFALPFISCNEDRVVYEVNKETIYQSSAEKKNLKTAQEFISIAYADIFGQDIPVSVLEELSQPYSGFGDKEILEDIIIKNFLNDPAAQIPTDTEMRGNIDAFVSDVYLKYYNRNPDEYESWKLKSIIEADVNLTPEIVLYSILTSQEYRYY